MDAQRFDFTSDGTDYTFWACKGDYLNLGAGMELGIYRRAEGLLGQLDHFSVDPSLAMDVTATLTQNGSEVGSYSGKHWWPSSFNPQIQGAKPDELTAQFSVNFGDNKQMYQDFKNAWNKAESLWSFNDDILTATLNF